MSSETRQEFGRRVRALRETRGFSLRQFALTIGINKSFLVDVEHGRKSPTLDTIERISNGLGVPISHLMIGVGPIKEPRHVPSPEPMRPGEPDAGPSRPHGAAVPRPE